jgi:hypothetical protein
MRIHDVVQGTTAWANLRAGIPTASQFHKIITPKTRKPSTQAPKYMLTLLAERVMGHPCDEFQSSWMARGKALEASAVSYYELQNNVDTTPIGFITNDAKTIGASPDRFVGDHGMLEVKCPSEAVHMGYLLGEDVDSDYYCQAMGQLWIAERMWIDVCSYHPDMPSVVVRVHRDEDFIDVLADAVESFSAALEDKAVVLRERGWII